MKLFYTLSSAALVLLTSSTPLVSAGSTPTCDTRACCLGKTWLPGLGNVHCSSECRKTVFCGGSGGAVRMINPGHTRVSKRAALRRHKRHSHHDRNYYKKNEGFRHQATHYEGYGGPGFNYDNYHNNPGYRMAGPPGHLPSELVAVAYNRSGHRDSADEDSADDYEENNEGYKQFKDMEAEGGWPQSELVAVSYSRHGHRDSADDSADYNYDLDEDSDNSGDADCQSISERGVCENTDGCMWEGARGFCNESY